jgi:DNA topoisomerase-1
MTDDPSPDALAPDDPAGSARAAGLRYVRDDEPGIERRRCGRGFSYRDPNGETIRDPERQRLVELAIPPAWTRVWICTSPRGHLQATGFDEKGRKQYLYHPRWNEVRQAEKYSRMLQLGVALPAIRRRVRSDLRSPHLDRNRVLAAIVRILDETGVRVGNERYRTQNGSYGLTTLRCKHVDIDGPAVELHFRGKAGMEQEIVVEDPALAAIIRQCHELPGYELFQYLDDEDRPRTVDSSDVNHYLEEIAGERLTAKQFRTWAGTKLALAEILKRLDGDGTPRDKSVLEIVDAVAARLGNQRATCREFYIHPALLEGFEQGELDTELAELTPVRAAALSTEERLLLAWLRTLE